MNNKEKIKKLIEENNHLKIAGIIIIVCLLIVAIGLTFKLNNENKNVCYDMKTLNESINKIQENCGSTQITHGFNDESNWYVLKQLMKEINQIIIIINWRIVLLKSNNSHDALEEKAE